MKLTRKQNHIQGGMEYDGTDLFIVFSGVRVARRGLPGTPQAKTWVSLEPGWRVLDGKRSIIVEYNGQRAALQ